MIDSDACIYIDNGRIAFVRYEVVVAKGVAGMVLSMVETLNR